MPAVRDPALKELYKLQKLCQEKGIDESVTKGIDKAAELIKARDEYCERISSDSSAALTTLATDTMSHPFEEAFKEGKTRWNLRPFMMSGFLEGNFLQSLVSMSKAKRVLEIGMFTGYAALACAEVLPADGEVITCEYDPYLEDVARSFFDKSPHGGKIEIRIGPANDTLQELAKEKQKFDVVFIDANKDGYIDYFKAIMSNDLLAKGGTILFDNALMGGVPYLKDDDPDSANPNGQAIKKCNEFLKTQEDMHKVLVPIRDGLFIVRRKEDVYG